MVKTIHRLIDICNERSKGYETAANNVEDPALAEVFRNLAFQSESFKGQLLPFIATAHSEMEEHTIEDAFVHWMDFKSEIPPNDLNGMIDFCEMGEKTTIAAYEEALENMLTDVHLRVVQDQLLNMKNTLELLDELKQRPKQQ